jgi:hypothetical protein
MATKIELKQDEIIEHLKEMLYLTGYASGQPETTSEQLFAELAVLKSAESGVSDEAIEKYFTTRHYDDKNGHHYRVAKDRIFGAKAMRDGKIK